MSDYLWDKSGAPDPEVERLEQLLGRYRSPESAPPRLSPKRPSFFPLAIAASLVVTCTGVWLLTHGTSAEWTVARTDGAPLVAARPLEGTARIRVGQTLETDAISRARLSVGAIGEVDVEPNSRLRVEQSRWTEHRIALDRGTISAMIWSPARTFFVDTPAAVAVDLGCKYVLTVDDAGRGKVRVILGWVGFERNGQESFIPEGALCETRPNAPLGTPYYEDSTEAFQSALRLLDFGNGGVAALAVVLAEARRRDAPSLWHLLTRLPPDQAAQVYDKLAGLAPPPLGVTRDGMIRRDKRMHDLWWDALGLENIEWWRKWKGIWPKD